MSEPDDSIPSQPSQQPRRSHDRPPRRRGGGGDRPRSRRDGGSDRPQNDSPHALAQRELARLRQRLDALERAVAEGATSGDQGSEPHDTLQLGRALLESMEALMRARQTPRKGWQGALDDALESLRARLGVAPADLAKLSVAPKIAPSAPATAVRELAEDEAEFGGTTPDDVDALAEFDDDDDLERAIFRDQHSEPGELEAPSATGRRQVAIPKGEIGAASGVQAWRDRRARASEREHESLEDRNVLLPLRESRSDRDQRIGWMLDNVEPFLEQERVNLQLAEAQLAAARGHAPVEVKALPVWEARDEIIDKLKRSRRMLLIGETGSGKTLLAPFLAMHAGLGRGGMIAHTQPRRVAARSISRRLAQMTDTRLGGPIGVHTRMDRELSRETVLKVATDGILLQEIKDDPLLRRYELIIIDEAHERNLNIDLTLGMLRRLLDRRDDLTLLVTSATIDEQKFRNYLDLDDDQVVTVPGRTFPVEVRYSEPPGRFPNESEDLCVHAANTVDRLCKEQPGDVLVFMPRVKEILSTLKALKRIGLHGCDLLPMHGKLTPEENDRIFQPSDKRKIVVATNIAETSITVPGVRMVVDSGLVNLNRYNPKSGIALLRPEAVSKASARQRQGRAGRLEDGVCVRLFDEDDFTTRPEFTDPEIRREDLAHTVLYMRALGIREIDKFPFVDRPDANQLRDAHYTLVELGALTPAPEYEVTAIGRRMAELPLEPRIARMVLAAERFGVVEEVLTIAACLSVDKDPLLMPSPSDPRQGNLETARRWINDKKKEYAAGVPSDFTSLLNIYNTWAARPWKGGERRVYCERHRLSMRVLEEIRQIRDDLVRALGGQLDRDRNGQHGQRPGDKRPPRRRSRHALVEFSSQPNNPAAINKAVLAGLVQNICVQNDKYEYLAGGKHSVYLHPGSVVFDRTPRPPIVVALTLERGEHKTYARTLAEVHVDWLIEVCPHVLSYYYSNARYDEPRGAVLAEESIYFYESTLVEGETVELAERNPDEAMQVLIKQGLLTGKLGVATDFITRNEKLVQEARTIATRLGYRYAEMLDYGLMAFYEDRLEGCRTRQDVLDRVHTNGGTEFLCITLDHLLDPHDQERAAEEFPERAVVNGVVCDVTYVYSPTDGTRRITLSVPQGAVGRVNDQAIDRAIPGLVYDRLRVYVEVLNELAKTGQHPYDVLKPIRESDVDDLIAATRREPLLWTHDAFRGWLLVARRFELPADFFEEPDKRAKGRHLFPTLEVKRKDGSRLAGGLNVASLQDQAEVDRVRRAWADTRAKVETDWTGAYSELPNLFTGLLEPVPVTTDANGKKHVGYVGVERSARGRLGQLRRAVFDTEEQAINASAGGVAQYAYLQLMLHPDLIARLDRLKDEVGDDLETRYYEMTGSPAQLGAVLRDWLVDPVFGAGVESIAKRVAKPKREADGAVAKDASTPMEAASESHTWITAELLKKGHAEFGPIVERWRKRIPALIDDAIALVTRVWTEFNLLEKRIAAGKIPIAAATLTEANLLLTRTREHMRTLTEHSLEGIADLADELDAMNRRIVDEGASARQAAKEQARQDAEREQQQAEQRKRDAVIDRNRQHYLALIEREADGANDDPSTHALAEQIFEALVRDAKLDLTAAIEWDEHAATPAAEERLLAIYEQIDTWLAAARTVRSNGNGAQQEELASALDHLAKP